MKFFSIKSLVLALVFLIGNDVINEFTKGEFDLQAVGSKSIIRISTLLTVWIFLTLGSMGKAKSRRLG
jgi:hypothetical protein